MGAETKYMHSAMAGAPTISGTAGHMIALLDACLINGFGSGTVDSVVVNSGVATVTRAAGHPFDVDSVTEIAGATPAGLNGQKKVLSVTTTTYTFDATGITDGTATGTITHKMAALGWTKAFSGTNLAAYKSADVASTACYLRVDDTGTTNARVVAYETMSDVNTGTGQFPTTAQQSGGLFWPKSSAADATTRTWLLVGDSRMFYLWVAYQSASSTVVALTVVFGDFVSKKSPDAYGCVIGGSNAAPTGSANSADAFYTDNSFSGNVFFPRSYAGIGSSKVGSKHAGVLASGIAGGLSGSAGLQYPNAADNGLYVTPMYVSEGSPNTLRGIMPGIYYSPQVIGSSAFAHRERVTGLTGLTGKVLRAVTGTSAVSMCGFFDVTGPWR